MRQAFPPFRAPLSVLLTLAVGACAGGEGGGDDEALELVGTVVEGFMTPESVLHDTAADVYLVSNINGQPTEKDDNGFISRVSPEGEILELKWIDGESPDVRLHAPKGMAIVGDSLFVADIDCVRVFHRDSAEELAEWCRKEAVFLNDIAVGPNQELFVTDSGRGDGTGSGPTAGALYRWDLRGRSGTLATGRELGRPSGVAVSSRGIFVVSMGSGEIATFTAGGARTVIVPASGRVLDGIVFLPDGGFLFSSWSERAVYRVGGDGSVAPIFRGLVSPADIGYDIRRNQVLIPLFQEDRIVLRALE